MSFSIYCFELGYLFQHIATFFQILKMQKKQNSECISLDTNLLFLIGALARIGWVWDSILRDFYLTYFELTLAVFLLTYTIYLQQKYKESNYCINDITVPVYLKFFALLPIVIIVSFFFNPGDQYFSNQFFVSFGMFCEAIGLLPQLYIIRKSKDSGDLSQLYIVFLGVARFFRLFFWITMMKEGNGFWCLIIGDIIHTLSLSTFIYNAIKNWSGQGLPTSFSELRANPSKKMF